MSGNKRKVVLVGTGMVGMSFAYAALNGLNLCSIFLLYDLGSLVLALFCCNRFGWGWDNFLAEANAGKGLKVQAWMKPVFRYVVPVIILFLYVYGLATFQWK